MSYGLIYLVTNKTNDKKYVGHAAYDVSIGTIDSLVTYKTWKHLP